MVRLLAVALLLACSPVTAVDAPTSTGSDTPGYVCEDVGQTCEADADCAAGLECVELPEAPGVRVCGQLCHRTNYKCRIGFCHQAPDERNGICRDEDGLPVGLCDGVPACAGDPCESSCANGLSCIAGACAFACEIAADCGAGQVCLAGACFANGGFADPCNP